MTDKTHTFEKNIARLEEIVEKMNGQVALDEALNLFEEADKLVRLCQKKLDEAQSRIEKIVQTKNEADAIATEPFDPS